MRTSRFVVMVMLTAACGGGDADCPDGFARDNDGNCVELGGGSNSNDNNDNTDDGNNDDGGPTGKAVGEACEWNEDCATGLCVFQYGDDVLGVCTESCNSWSDCSEAFWECCDLSNGGFVCTPDSWVDEFDLDCD